jgi:hypothetical protein
MAKRTGKQAGGTRQPGRAGLPPPPRLPGHYHQRRNHQHRNHRHPERDQQDQDARGSGRGILPSPRRAVPLRALTATPRPVLPPRLFPPQAPAHPPADFGLLPPRQPLILLRPGAVTALGADVGFLVPSQPLVLLGPGAVAADALVVPDSGVTGAAPLAHAAPPGCTGKQRSSRPTVPLSSLQSCTPDVSAAGYSDLSDLTSKLAFGCTCVRA